MAFDALGPSRNFPTLVRPPWRLIVPRGIDKGAECRAILAVGTTKTNVGAKPLNEYIKEAAGGVQKLI